MKILAVGDPHGNEKVFDIPIGNDIDAVFITGDLGKSDLIRKYYFEYSIKKGIKNWKDMISKKELKSLYSEIINSSYKVLKYFSSKKPTFFVLGNLREIRTENIMKSEKKYGISLPKFEDKISKLKNLINLSLCTKKFKGLKISGVPFFENLDWVRRFSLNDQKLIENAKKEEPPAREYIKKLGKIDILITHIPPYGILDTVKSKHVPKEWLGKHAGNKMILDYIKKKCPGLVLCGHVHEAKGRKRVGKTEVYNLGCCGEYKIIEI